ncbi:unnamed protein product [Symbiodinium necroappetens]|uniref:Uncharacterized protein n=1 Tax=Symbiodinium necroappetens TaxID=1628268 RepID=A0A812KFT8_9DINO|nr:unnamed protein product [Symbiodinium necroappetens]
MEVTVKAYRWANVTERDVPVHLRIGPCLHTAVANIKERQPRTDSNGLTGECDVQVGCAYVTRKDPRFEYFSFSSPERAWRLAMASWDRYGEDKKYRKDVDVNDNPKHVGEPLRKLTLEDRLELRRQTREQQKKRSVLAEIDAADDSDGLDDSRPVKRTKSSGEGSGEQSPDLDIVNVATNGKTNGKEVVDLAEDDIGKRAAAIRRARRRAMAQAAKAAPVPRPPASAVLDPEVEVLE